MDGLAQSEYVHRTESGLQGPRVILTFRWITQHITSCPLAGVVGLGTGDSNWASFWVMILLLSIWLCSLPVACMDQATERGGVATVVRVHPTGGALPSMGSCLLGWEKALATVAALGGEVEIMFFFTEHGSQVSHPAKYTGDQWVTMMFS